MFAHRVAITSVVTLALLALTGDRTVSSEPQSGSSPLLTYALEASARHAIEGIVETRIVAGDYVYLRLRSSNGEQQWLVSLAATTPAESRVRALVIGRAEHFHSRRLDRDFSPLLFAAVRATAP
jgi:hypothetical protein